MKCKYVVSYTSAVTGNPRSTGYPNKKLADADAAALRKEGCKNVVVYPYSPAHIN
jgi:hypothetical protein